jgi:uncharacterized RDD family membrane protein YckC
MRTDDLSPRAGFWRRLFAFLIDFALIIAITGPIGLWLGSATSGSVRISNTIVDSSVCMGGTMPPELQLPSDFKVTNIVQCTKYFFGIPHDWVLSLIERTPLGSNSAYTRGVTVPLDPTGQLTNPFYVDILAPFLLAAYLFLAERKFGSSVGKRTLRVVVRSIDGKPLRAIQAAKRTVLYMVPILSYQTILLYLMMIDSRKWVVEVFGHATAYRAAWLAIILLTLAFAINFIVTTWRRTLPWHDEWAGTEVVRLSNNLDQPSKDISETFA